METKDITGNPEFSPAAQVLQRISNYFIIHINIDLLVSGKPKLRRREMERLQRFSEQFSYGMALHLFNEPLPFFVNCAFFEMANAKPSPPFDSGMAWMLALYDNKCLDSFGNFMGTLMCAPDKPLLLHFRFAGGKETAPVTWCSCVVKFNGRKAYAALSLFMPAGLPVQMPAPGAGNEASTLALIMSFNLRQYEVYCLMRQPLSNHERAEKLNISDNTYDTYRKAVNKKIKFYTGG